MHQNSDYQPSSVKHFSQPSVKESVLKPIPQVSAYLIELQRLFKSLSWRKSSWRRRSQAVHVNLFLYVQEQALHCTIIITFQ
jgi:hypothetical protein